MIALNGHLSYYNLTYDKFINSYKGKQGIQMKANHIRRISQGNQIQPMMPRISYSPQQGTRTVYRQIPPPHQQLLQYKRRLLFDNIPAVQSQKDRYANKNINAVQKSKQIESSRKNTQTIMTMGSEADLKTQKQNNSIHQFSVPPVNPINTKSLKSIEVQLAQFENGNDAAMQHNQFLPSPNNQINNQGQKQNNDGNENDNEDVMAGYTIGNQIQEAGSYMQSEEGNIKNKKYKNSDKYGAQAIKNVYNPVTSAEMRMEYKYIYDKYKIMSERKKDQQFQRLVNEYKLNKQMFLNQNRRKNQSMKTFALIKKHSSLPKLPNLFQTQKQKVSQIVLPTFQENSKSNKQNPQKNEKQERQEKCLSKSMSTARFDFIKVKGKQKQKHISLDKHLQEQISYALNTERILREKGIKIDSCCLKNSLINVRNIPIHQGENSFPSARLLSNGKSLDKPKGKLPKCGYK